MITGDSQKQMDSSNNITSDVYKAATLIGEEYGAPLLGQQMASFTQQRDAMPHNVESRTRIGASMMHHDNSQATNGLRSTAQEQTTTTTSYGALRSMMPPNPIPQLSQQQQQHQQQQFSSGSYQIQGSYPTHQNYYPTTESNLADSQLRREIHTTTQKSGQQEEHTRKVSSVIVESSLVGEVPEDTVRYVQVPVYEEEVEYITVPETRYVPSTTVLEPEIIYVDKVVYNEVVHEIEERKYVPNKLGPIVKKVYKPDPNKPQKRVEPIYHDQPVPNFVDHEVPVIVAQTSRPIIREHNEKVEVRAADYQPEIRPVDVHLIRPVENTLQLIDSVKSKHKLVEIGAAQYNTLLRSLNAGINCELPYVSQNGRIEYVSEQDLKYTIAPRGIVIEGWQPKSPDRTMFGSSTGNSMLRSQDALNVSSRTRQMNSSGVLIGTREAITVRPDSATNMLSRAEDRRSMASSAYSAPKDPKNRGLPEAQKHSNIENESNSSSVSSSINKIASQIQERSAKRGYLCCGNPQQSQQSISRLSMDNPPSQCTYPTTSTTQQAAEAAASSTLSRHQIRVTGTTGSRSARGGAFAQEDVSHHISGHASHSNARQARVC